MEFQKKNGFTYLGLLFILTMISISLAMAGTLWSFAQKRELERQLFFVGNQFKRAIELYYQRTPGMVKQYPSSIENLLQDNRYVTTERYLRRIYQDPISGGYEWGLVSSPEGGIMGVYSLSKGKPVKAMYLSAQTKLPITIKTYADWQFTYASPASIQAP